MDEHFHDNKAKRLSRAETDAVNFVQPRGCGSALGQVTGADHVAVAHSMFHQQMSRMDHQEVSHMFRQPMHCVTAVGGHTHMRETALLRRDVAITVRCMDITPNPNFVKLGDVVVHL